MIEQIDGFQASADEAQQIASTDPDPEMAAMAAEELAGLRASIEVTRAKLDALAAGPAQAADERDILLEVRAGAGGEEAALFAAELLRMYLRFAERSGLKADLISKNETDGSGVREAVIEVRGKRAWSTFRFESGVHRVQRIPATESSGRVHTSTATVAVMPKVAETEFELNLSDVRIDTYCATGPGGQGVNTTYSAVRLTHIPTGTVVAIQDEKSQVSNKEKAFALLRSRLAAAQREREAAERAAERRDQVGSGDRAEKIRTYNFGQDRMTDHRIGLDRHNLKGILDGDLASVVEALSSAGAA